MPALAYRLLAMSLAGVVLAAGSHAARGAVGTANGRIAFVSQSTNPPSIWVVNPDGNGSRMLVEGIEPSWSPDGSRLAYVRPDRAQGTAIYLANADGTGRHALTTPGTVGDSPDWSPDGTQIAFSGRGDIYTIGVDGSGLTQLTSGTDDQRPTWSPDGEAIAFDRERAVWVMDADGGNQRALGFRGEAPRFSPDGRFLAFEDAGAVYVVGAAGTGAPRLVSPTGITSGVPAWSPDGSRLAFIAGDGVCTAQSDGSRARRVTYDRGVHGPLDWQPRPVAMGGDSPYSCSSPRWDLSVAVRTARTRAAIGDYVAFRVVLFNSGPDPATDSSFSVGWSEEADFDGIANPRGECTLEPGSGRRVTFVNCDPGVVFPGKPVTVATISVRMQAPGPQRIAAEMGAFDPPQDTNADNERASATVVVSGCTITGTTGADVLTGTSRRDVICGLDGHDVIRGLGGNDEIWGGPRDDLVDGGRGQDRLFGGGGDDDLDGGLGDDVLWGGLGKDSISGREGNDALDGDDRLDRFGGDTSFPEEPDVLDGGPGADVLDGGVGVDSLRAGRGNDAVLARDGYRESVDCGAGRDRLRADRADRQQRCERISRR